MLEHLIVFRVLLSMLSLLVRFILYKLRSIILRQPAGVAFLQPYEQYQRSEIVALMCKWALLLRARVLRKVLARYGLTSCLFITQCAVLASGPVVALPTVRKAHST
jgi:hypothetical protein